jgi:prepilin-type processing-associated H-X9-DG protein
MAMGLFVDGHVHSLTRNTPIDALKAIISVAGNDDEVARAAE